MYDEASSDPLPLGSGKPTFESLNAPAEETPDIDPNAWLGHNEIPHGFVELASGRLKLAAITEGELSGLMKQAQKFDKNTKRTRLDSGLLRLLVICKSINKANGSNLIPDQLNNKLSGELTKIQKEIFSLSGLDTDDEEAPKAEDFFG